jgi:signal transduction histidine kinase
MIVLISVIKLILALLLLRSRPDGGTRRWCALFVLFSTLFEVSDYVRLHAAPSPYIAFVQQVIVFLRETGMPYALLMAAVAYWEPRRGSAALWIALLLVPPGLTAFTLQDGQLRLESPYFIAWCSAYLLAAILLLLGKSSFGRGQPPSRGKILELFALVLGMIALLLFHYLADITLNPGNYELVGIVLAFVLLLIALTQREALYTWRRRTRDVEAGTRRALAAGMAMLEGSVQHRLTRLELLAKRIAEASVMTEAGQGQAFGLAAQSETAAGPGTGPESADAEAAAAIEAKLLTEMEAEWRAELQMEPKTELEAELALAASAHTVREQIRKLRAAMRRMRLHTAPVELDEQPYSLNELVREAIASAAAAGYHSEKKAAVRFRPQLHAVYRCDAAHLREALLALLHNALDALPAQGGAVEIRLERIGRRRIKLDISDNGHGMTPELLPRLGEQFLSTRTDEPDHFGLGLSYCRTVVERHGGKLMIESKPGQGATSTVLLPMRRVAAMAAPDGVKL